MPIYEYQCGQCGHVFEDWRNRTDPPPEVCPSCGEGGAISRLISQSNFQLKGGGWYVTEYGKGNSRGGASEPSSASDTSGASDAGSSSGADTSSASSGSSSDASV